MSDTNLYQRLGAENVNEIVENFYEKLLDDYRVRRFFNDSGKKEQLATFKAVVNAALTGNSNDAAFIRLVSDFFMAAFARFKDKELLPESSFAYFGMIISQDHPIKSIMTNCWK
jgi:hypothetical protein